MADQCRDIVTFFFFFLFFWCLYRDKTDITNLNKVLLRLDQMYNKLGWTHAIEFL